MTAQTIRAFLAIPPDRSAHALLREYQQCLIATEGSQGIRWVKPEQFHLTVRFLGNLSPGQIQALVALLNHSLRRNGHLSLTLGAPVFFPAHRPHTIVCPVPTTPALQQLVDLGEKCAQAVGVEAERRQFQGHITLGRCKDMPMQRNRPVLAYDPPQLPWIATALVLYQSSLTPQGAIYTQLAAWDLE
ncbi:MAG: RNA 2',3'-cyclic phosphodiesterase [Pseudanabaenaceae cyanobacterium]